MEVGNGVEVGSGVQEVVVWHFEHWPR
jgi:hypothetical protein